MDHQDSTCSRIAPPESRDTQKGTCNSEQAVHGFRWEKRSFYGVDEDQESSCRIKPPPNVDPEVFKLLPGEIQKELLSPAYLSSLPSLSVSEARHMSQNKLPEKDSPMKGNPFGMNHQCPTGVSIIQGENVMEQEELSLPRSSDCNFPGNVDPEVFSELPPDVQKELMSEWKQQKPILKISSSRKTGKSSTSKGKDRKTEGRTSQSNNLFKYLKPG